MELKLVLVYLGNKPLKFNALASDCTVYLPLYYGEMGVLWHIPMPYIVPFVNCESCSIITCWGRITTYFYAWWIILPIMVVFFGRAFCSWFCPSGWVNQMLGKISMGPLRNRKSYMRFLQLGMVATIILGLVVYFKFGNPRIMIPIRTSDEYFNAVILSMQFSEWYWAARTITVVSIIAGSLIIRQCLVPLCMSFWGR